MIVTSTRLAGEDLEPKDPKYSEVDEVYDYGDRDGNGFENMDSSYGAFDE
jgi:hypothetical protein